MSDTMFDTLCTFEQPVKPTDAVLRSLEELYTETMLECWQKKGLTNIRPLETDSPCRLFSAQLAGERGACVVAVSAPAAGLLHLRAVSEAQCERIEREFAGASVFYSAMALAEQSLLLLGPAPIRVRGKWLTEDVELDQFLPRSRREHDGGLLGALLGDVYYLKFTRILVPYLTQQGQAGFPKVSGWEPNKKDEKRYFCMRAAEASPCWVGLLEIDADEKHLNFSRPVFYHDVEPYSELELVSRDAAQRPYGIIELLTSTGYRFRAECLEAAVFGESLPAGRRYQCALSMVAEECRYNTQEISITSGAFFEMMKEEYRKDNGEEPPADFAFTVTTAAMRMLNQEEEGEYAASAMLTGVVESLHEVALPAGEFPFETCLMAEIRCIPDDEDTVVCVYLPPTVLGDYEPKVGDNIACSGTLCAAAKELVEAGESWQDSAAVAEQQDDGEQWREAHSYFDACKESSLALATVAAAFVNGGWSVASFDPDHFSRNYVPLSVRNQRGDAASVFVDTVIDGHEPQFSYAVQRELIETACRERGETAIFATVELRYHSTSDRYGVSMSLSPEQEGVKNSLILCAEGFSGSISRLTAGGVEETPTRPEQLDEADAARIFCEAFSTGNWTEAAKWMREEMHYCSHTNGTECFGKIDYLRYITERIENRKLEGRWENFSFDTGSVGYEGRRRPCMVMCYEGEPTGMLVFGDKLGTIGELTAVPREAFASFIPLSTLPQS